MNNTILNRSGVIEIVIHLVYYIQQTKYPNQQKHAQRR
jgi:hypothetical protein